MEGTLTACFHQPVVWESALAVAVIILPMAPAPVQNRNTQPLSNEYIAGLLIGFKILLLLRYGVAAVRYLSIFTTGNTKNLLL
ncbi:hypothetical protein [Adhaeribacter aerolatus]|uniref:hypothetical protein n=1 Tax=Adhaeribacter aerolatus TaxID=670289 RepID=UPI0011BF8AE3|nr:hypothetical protein [Adhaeribacter aerolatus]